jgi:hypothetical protein
VKLRILDPSIFCSVVHANTHNIFLRSERYIKCHVLGHPSNVIQGLKHLLQIREVPGVNRVPVKACFCFEYPVVCLSGNGT